MVLHFRYLEHRLITGKERAGDSGPIAVKNASMVSPSEVSKYIGELGIVKMALKEADIEHILDTIVADGKAERSESMEGSVLYRAVVPYLESAGFSRWVTWTKASFSPLELPVISFFS